MDNQTVLYDRRRQRTRFFGVFVVLVAAFWALIVLNINIGRAHRSHRWGRWFESNCHHHSEALVDQGLLLLCLHPGVHCPGVVFVGVNGSDNPNCQDFGYGFL